MTPPAEADPHQRATGRPERPMPQHPAARRWPAPQLALDEALDTHTADLTRPNHHHLLARPLRRTTKQARVEQEKEEHRGAAVTVAGRRLLIERIRFQGWPVTRAAEAQGVSRAERFHLTLKNEWAYVRPYTSNQQRLAPLPGWLDDCNRHHPHAALDGQAPMSHVDNMAENHI